MSSAAAMIMASSAFTCHVVGCLCVNRGPRSICVTLSGGRSGSCTWPLRFARSHPSDVSTTGATWRTRPHSVDPTHVAPQSVGALRKVHHQRARALPKQRTLMRLSDIHSTESRTHLSSNMLCGCGLKLSPPSSLRRTDLF